MASQKVISNSFLVFTLVRFSSHLLQKQQLMIVREVLCQKHIQICFQLPFANHMPRYQTFICQETWPPKTIFHLILLTMVNPQKLKLQIKGNYCIPRLPVREKTYKSREVQLLIYSTYCVINNMLKNNLKVPAIKNEYKNNYLPDI